MNSMVKAAKIFRYSKKPATKSDNRPNSYRRGYGGKRWQIARRRIFLRDNYTCQNPDCGRFCIENARDPGLRPHCDHIIPVAKGGSDEDENKQTLCGSCHSIKTIKEKRGGGGK